MLRSILSGAAGVVENAETFQLTAGSTTPSAALTMLRDIFLSRIHPSVEEANVARTTETDRIVLHGEERL